MSSETKVRFFNPALDYEKRKEMMQSEIDRVLLAGNLVGPTQPDVLQFEQNLAKFCGKKYAVGLNSGTDALYLSLKAIGVERGDEVIVSAHTFVASIQVIVQLGATPVLVDLGEDWQWHITPKTKAVVPCHLAGEVLNWVPVDGIPMVDDSCQAFGADGLEGLVQCWSFYPAKILGAYGDAGGITTDSESLARDIKDLGNHWKSDYSQWGINSRLDNIQAAILNVKLKDIQTTLSKRKAVAMMYNVGLTGIGLGTPKNKQRHVWQDYIITTYNRDLLYSYLKEMGVETMKNEYPLPMRKTPKATEYERSSLRLPCNEHLTRSEVGYVIECVNKFHE